MTEPSSPELPIDPDDEQGIDVFRHGREITRRWDIALVIAAGGAVGGAARYLLSTTVTSPTGAFPWSTFIENVSGSLLLGALMVLLLEVWSPTRYARPFLGIGVLGGYTTFSTYTTETDALIRAGEVPLALTYLFATLAAGLIAAWVGLTSTRALTGISNDNRRTP